MNMVLPANLTSAGGGADLREAAIDGELDALNNLGGLLESQGRLAEARQAYREAVDSGDIWALHNLGNLAGKEGDFEEAARCWWQAAEAGVPHAMYALGMYLLRKGHQAQARLLYEQAVAETAAMPDADPLRAGLDQLGKTLAAVPARAPDDPIVAARDLHKLGRARYLDSLYTRDPRAQAHAVIALHEATGLRSGGHALKPGTLCDLSAALLNNALDDQDRRKFDAAAEEVRAALRATPAGTADHFMRQASLGLVLMSRFESCYGETGELDEAESVLRDALAGLPALDMRRAMVESYLARAAQLRQDIRDHGWPPDDGQPAGNGVGGINATRRPEGGHRWIIEPGADVVGFCTQSLEDYRRRNEPHSLQMALEITEAALTETYPGSDRRRYPILVIRGILLLAGHERGGDNAMVIKALEAAREARKHIARSDFAQLALLKEWADSLRAAHAQVAEPALLAEAAHVLDHVSGIHMMWHRLSRDGRPDPRHLDGAVEAARDALALSAVGSTDYASHAFSMGLVLMMRHADRGGSNSELEEAERHLRAALIGLPRGGRRRAEIEQCIAVARQMRS